MKDEALASPKDAALKLALEALEYWDVHGKLHQPTEEAITAIEAALAQPAQEPVAWHDKIMGMEVSMDVSTGEVDIDHRVYGKVYEVILSDEGGTPDVILAIKSEQNYTTPPQRTWVGLTEDEMDKVRQSVGYNQFMSAGEYAKLVQFVTQTKLKEKNNG